MNISFNSPPHCLSRSPPPSTFPPPILPSTSPLSHPPSPPLPPNYHTPTWTYSAPAHSPASTWCSWDSTNTAAGISDQWPPASYSLTSKGWPCPGRCPRPQCRGWSSLRLCRLRDCRRAWSPGRKARNWIASCPGSASCPLSGSGHWPFASSSVGMLWSSGLSLGSL